MTVGRLIPWRRPFAAASFALLTLLAVASGHRALAEDAPADLASPAQTDVNRAQHGFDREGVPLLDIEGVGKVRHPAWTALYALAYAGTEAYEERLKGLEDPAKFQACIRWLENNLTETPGGLRVWRYDFDNTYNDITVRAPWSSAFAQATGIQALIAAWRSDGKPGHLDLARKAAKALLVPLDQGGLLFQRGRDVWFEEIPVPAANPGHILNGHMRTLLALRELADATGDASIRDWYRRGLATLERWLPLYDTGYWLRYDLNPRKHDLLFRFANPYGFPSHAMAVDKITLRDPANGRELVLDVGEPNDADGGPRIAGLDWGPRETIEQRSARRIVPAVLERVPDQLAAPHSYFYLDLPGEWEDSLRSRWFELAIDYFDDGPANLTVQQRTISPGATFRDMRDGDLLLTGAGHWRRWIVPVRANELGYWVGTGYAQKHAQYLRALATDSETISAWARTATAYYNAAALTSGDYAIKPAALPPMPEQTPMLPIYSLDRDGVLLQHQASKESRFLPNGLFDPKSDRGAGRYSPFIVAEQLRLGPDIQGGAYSTINRGSVRREPALDWLLNPANQKSAGDAITYWFDFDNSYNDVFTPAGWPSAFSQAYILKALGTAERELKPGKDLRPLMKRVANAYRLDVTEGGISTRDRKWTTWFEEVPNATHVLNAHLISTAELAETARDLDDQSLRLLQQQGVNALREHLADFDSGYWLRYDQNPKKELLFQFNWLEGEASPLIERITLQNPASETATQINVGTDAAFEGASRISGLDWAAAQVVDDRSARPFYNGYLARAEPVPNGARHNAFFVGVLPEPTFSDSFDVPAHQLVIRYKDVARGRFAIRIQAINEGDQLRFTPLRNGVLETSGDGQWKEAKFDVRPQDLGWYKGPDYQQFELDQLQDIANATNDWFFYQYAERHRQFLANQREGIASIVEQSPQRTSFQVKATVRESSPTYEGFGFENALDGDPNDDYVAGVERQAKQYVDLALDTPTRLRAITIEWENDQNFARRVRVVRLGGKAGTADELLAEVDGLSGPTSTIELPASDDIDALRLEFLDLAGQPRVLLRQIELKPVVPTSAVVIPSVAETGKPFLPPRDGRNPLALFRIPVSERMKHLSDRLAEGATSEHDKILRFLDYIAQFRVGFASAPTPDATVDEQTGACGTYTNTLLALAAAQGMYGRHINLMNFPKNAGHTVAEIRIDGQWHVYDPTYATFYVRKHAPDSLPLSFEELRQRYRDEPDSVQRVSRTYRPGFESFTGRDIFLKAMPAGPIGPDKPMFFPLTLTLKRGLIEKSQFGTNLQGADYLGAAATNQNQRWHLKELEPGKRYEFVVTPDWLGGDLKEGELSFEMDVRVAGAAAPAEVRHVFDFSSGHAAPFALQFEAGSREATIELAHPYRGPDYRYVHMNSYRLRPVSH